MSSSESETYLIDKSAYVRLAASNDPQAWANRTERGLIHVTVATVLEIGYSARSAQDWQDLVRLPPLSMFPIVHLTPAIEMRAIDLQEALSRRGLHRAPSVSDLLIAAAGERLGLTVLHADKDFDLIAEVTGQSVERLGC